MRQRPLVSLHVVMLVLIIEMLIMLLLRGSVARQLPTVSVCVVKTVL